MGAGFAFMSLVLTLSFCHLTSACRKGLTSRMDNDNLITMKKVVYCILAVGLVCFLIGYALKIDMRLRLRQSSRESETQARSAALDIWVAHHNGVPGIFTADVRLNSMLLAAILENRRQKGGNPPLRIRAEDGIGADFLLPLVEQGISTGLTNITILLKQDLGKDLDMFRRRLEAPDPPCIVN